MQTIPLNPPPPAIFPLFLVLVNTQVTQNPDRPNQILTCNPDRPSSCVVRSPVPPIGPPPPLPPVLQCCSVPESTPAPTTTLKPTTVRDVCPEGAYFNLEQNQCQLCQPGFICIDGIRSDCPPGFYCPSASLSEGIPCPAGSYCPRNSRIYQSCEGNFFSEAEFAVCTECPVLSLVNAEKTGCEFCDDGEFLIDVIEFGPNPVCRPCPRGSVCKSSRQTPCPPGFYCPDTNMSVGISCPTGFYCPVSTVDPFACLNGFVAPYIESTECLQCEVNLQVNNEDNTQCVFCDDGYFKNFEENGVCEICPVGSKCEQSVKTVCREGYYQDTVGEADCKFCPDRFFCEGGAVPPVDCDDFLEDVPQACVDGHVTTKPPPIITTPPPFPPLTTLKPTTTQAPSTNSPVTQEETVKFDLVRTYDGQFLSNETFTASIHVNQSHEQYNLIKDRHMTAMELMFLPGEIRKDDGSISVLIETATHRYSDLRFTGFSEKMQTSSFGRKRRAIVAGTLIVNYGVTLEVDSSTETRAPMKVFNDTIATNYRLLEEYGLEFFQVEEEEVATSSGALSTGAWIGIGIAIALVVIAIIAGIMYWRKTKTRKSWYANAANDFSTESSKRKEKEEDEVKGEDNEVSGNDSDVDSEVGSVVSDQIVDVRI